MSETEKAKQTREISGQVEVCPKTFSFFCFVSVPLWKTNVVVVVVRPCSLSWIIECFISHELVTCANLKYFMIFILNTQLVTICFANSTRAGQGEGERTVPLPMGPQIVPPLSE